MIYPILPWPTGEVFCLFKRAVSGNLAWGQRSAECPVAPVGEREEEVHVRLRVHMMNEMMSIYEGKPGLRLYELELAGIVYCVVDPHE